MVTVNSPIAHLGTRDAFQLLVRRGVHLESDGGDDGGRRGCRGNGGAA